MKRAIVLGGGGTKGSYELGVWKALREMELDYQIVTGTSIGSINGALMATRDYDRAKELWDNITMDDLMEDGINLTTTIEGMYNQREAIRPFLKKYVKNKGADISPFTAFIERLVEEEKIRESKVDFGLVTVQFPSLKPCELTKAEIPEGMLQHYLLASSAIFPLFPMHKIEEQLYVDGCYHDNLPIHLALRMGAEEVVAVDLSTTPVHPAYQNCPYVTYIKPSRSLGTMMNFDRDILRENEQMGYCDTMKAYGKYEGMQYTFHKGSIKKKELRRFHKLLIQADLAMNGDISAKKLVKGETVRLLAVLSDRAAGGDLTGNGALISAAELCGEIFGVDKKPVYDMKDYLAELKACLKPQEAYREAEQLCEKEGMELVRRLTELKVWQKKDYLCGCIYYVLQDRLREKGRLMLPLATVLPEELIAALLLCSIGE